MGHHHRPCGPEGERGPVDRGAPHFLAVGGIDVDPDHVACRGDPGARRTEFHPLDGDLERVVSPDVVSALQKLAGNDIAIEGHPVALGREIGAAAIGVDVECRQAERGRRGNAALGNELCHVLLECPVDQDFEHQRTAAAEGATGVESGSGVDHESRVVFLGWLESGTAGMGADLEVAVRWSSDIDVIRVAWAWIARGRGAAQQRGTQK